MFINPPPTFHSDWDSIYKKKNMSALGIKVMSRFAQKNIL